MSEKAISYFKHALFIYIIKKILAFCLINFVISIVALSNDIELISGDNLRSEP
jgi:hypothetical protein